MNLIFSFELTASTFGEDGSLDEIAEELLVFLASNLGDSVLAGSNKDLGIRSGSSFKSSCALNFLTSISPKVDKNYL